MDLLYSNLKEYLCHQLSSHKILMLSSQGFKPAVYKPQVSFSNPWLPSTYVAELLLLQAQAKTGPVPHASGQGIVSHGSE